MFVVIDNYLPLYIGTPEFTVESLMTRFCCSTKTVTCFKFLAQNTIDHLRSTIYSVSETEQTQMILNYMHEHSQGRQGVLYTVGGHVVCETCFHMVYGLRYSRFASIKSKFLNGVLVFEHGRLGRSGTTDMSIRVISWLRSFIAKVGDKMPTSSDIHLPSCLSQEL